MRTIRYRDSRLRDSLAMEIGRIFRWQARFFAKTMKPHGVSQTQASILMTLWLEGPMTMGELQALMAIQSSTLTGLVDRMEKSSLVQRVAVPGDRRAYRLEPAPWPKAKRDAMISNLMETEAELYGRLTKTEHRTLRALLRKATGDDG